jgi:hypothetical protein
LPDSQDLAIQETMPASSAQRTSGSFTQGPNKIDPSRNAA